MSKPRATNVNYRVGKPRRTNVPGEWKVPMLKDGKPYEPGAYYTDDKQDAKAMEAQLNQNPRLVKYASLTPAQQADVKRRFVHWRHDTTSPTFEAWANKHAFHAPQLHNNPRPTDKPGVKSFLSRQFAALNRRYLGLLHIGLSFHRDTIYLNALYSYVTAPPGTGSRFMQDLCRLADSVGADIELSPASEDLNQGESDFKKTTSIARLQEFYSRFGFRVIDENTMRREH